VLARYEIRIAHRFDEGMVAAFEGLEVSGEGDFTVVSGDLDQAALHGTLERIRMLALELVEARRTGRPTQREGS
jgi:hypothetical protein